MTESYVSPELTIEELLGVIHARDDVINKLIGDRDVARKYSASRLTMIDDLAAKIRTAEILINEWAEYEAIDNDMVDSISDIFGWDTTKEVQVTVTSVFRGTITVPRRTDDDYLDEKFSVSCDPCDSLEGYMDCDSLEVEVN